MNLRSDVFRVLGSPCGAVKEGRKEENKSMVASARGNKKRLPVQGGSVMLLMNWAATPNFFLSPSNK